MAPRHIEGAEHLARRAGSAEWQIRFTIAGRRIRESAGTTDKALAASRAVQRHAELYRALVLGEAPVPADMRLGEAADRFHAEVGRHTPNGAGHQRHVLAVLRRVLGDEMPLRGIDDGAVARLVAALRDGGRAPATVNRYVAMLAVVCRRARDVWRVPVGAWHPAAHRMAEPAGREVFLDQAQAQRLMGEACGHLRPILLLELLTGLRMRNAVGLAWENVSLDLGRALLIQKGGRRLRVELPGAAVRMLQHIQPDEVERRGPVFVFGNPQAACSCPRCVAAQYRGEPIRDIRTAFGGAARRAGVLWNGQTRLRFHDLRHTFASWLLAETGNLQLVREALGHAQISTTQRYAHLLPGARAQAAEAIAAGLERPSTTERRKA